MIRRCWMAVLLLLLSSGAVCAEDKAQGRLTGAWIPKEIGPISGGFIYAFSVKGGPPPQRDRPLRSPDGVAVTDDRGRFSMDLPTGTYYLSTRKRVGGESPGPPQEGDLYGLIRNKKGKLITYRVKRGKTTTVGVLQQATVFRSREIAAPEGMTAIQGTITAPDGKPQAGAVVLVYDGPDMRGKPSYVSHQTGTDGKYVVKVASKGTYYLAIRDVDSAGRPKAGVIFGVYGGETPLPVTVSKHGVTGGIDIQAGHFTGRQPEQTP